MRPGEEPRPRISRHYICAKDAVLSIGDKILSTLSYGKVFLVFGALFNAACVFFLSQSFFYSGLVLAFILKVFFTALVWYLRSQFVSRDAVFFYINLGCSPRKLLAGTLAIDFGLLFLMLTLLTVLQ
jgi:hypothetical protein